MVTVGVTSLNSNILSLGSILGTAGDRALIDNINAVAGAGSYFGSNEDPYRYDYNHFQMAVLKPLEADRIKIMDTAAKLFNPDVIKPITSLKDLSNGVPSAMVLPILYYPPIRHLLEEESIYGFGIDPKTLQENDPYEHLLTNGKREFTSADLDNKGCIEFTWRFTSVDPILSDKELQAIQDTRDYLGKFLTDPETKDIDPTDYPRLRH